MISGKFENIIIQNPFNTMKAVYYSILCLISSVFSNAKIESHEYEENVMLLPEEETYIFNVASSGKVPKCCDFYKSPHKKEFPFRVIRSSSIQDYKSEVLKDLKRICTHCYSRLKLSEYLHEYKLANDLKGPIKIVGMEPPYSLFIFRNSLAAEVLVFQSNIKELFLILVSEFSIELLQLNLRSSFSYYMKDKPKAIKISEFHLKELRKMENLVFFPIGRLFTHENMPIFNSLSYI